MLKSSKALSRRVDKAKQKISKLDGVVQCHTLNVWEITPKKAAVASVELIVRDNIDH